MSLIIWGKLEMSLQKTSMQFIGATLPAVRRGVKRTIIPLKLAIELSQIPGVN